MQEIVSAGGWAMGNAMAFLFDECVPTTDILCDSEQKRSAYSYDYRPDDAARLIVYFTGATPDQTPPSAPATLIASSVSAPVDLVWSESDDADSGVSGYHVYRGDSPASAVWLADVPRGLSYTDTTSAPNATYY